MQERLRRIKEETNLFFLLLGENSCALSNCKELGNKGNFICLFLAWYLSYNLHINQFYCFVFMLIRACCTVVTRFPWQLLSKICMYQYKYLFFWLENIETIKTRYFIKEVQGCRNYDWNQYWRHACIVW